MCDLSGGCTAIRRCGSPFSHWTLIFISIFYHSAETITAGCVKSKTLSLVLSPLWLVCAGSNMFENRIMRVVSHIQILLFTLRHQQCHHAQQISSFPVYWRGHKCIIRMQVFTHRHSVQECGWMCSCICYCICYSYLKVSAGSLCWLDLEREAGRADCRQRRNLSADTWTDYETTRNWAQTCGRTPTPLTLAKEKNKNNTTIVNDVAMMWFCTSVVDFWSD